MIFLTNSESNLQQKCVAYLKKRKIYHVNVHGGGWGAKGTPDILACINGDFVAFELKVGSNKMQPDQIIHQRRIVRSGGKHYTPYTVKEFIEIIEGLIT